jgi:hypothetical protein
MRRYAVVALVVGVLLALLPVGWWLTRPPAEAGGDAATRLADAPTTLAPAAPPATPSSTPTRPGATPTTPGAVPTTKRAGGGRVLPARLIAPSIGVDARIVPVGLEAGTGEMQVPKVVDVVGWYRFGPALAERAGSTVIAGHVDDARQGAGAFFRLRELGLSQQFGIEGGDGVRHRYRVVAREVFAKDQMPLDRLFARDGAPRITLITCGGDFDRSRRSYRDNVVVTAVEEGGR